MRVCSGCDYFSKSEEDYFCCHVNNHIKYSFDMGSLEKECPLDDDVDKLIKR